MALDSRYNLIPLPYKVGVAPGSYRDLGRWSDEELQKISATLVQLIEAVPQVADSPPRSPRKGTIRYAVQPWDPLATGEETWVWWNGTAWQKFNNP